MATLPTPGGDSGTWGTELNEFFTGTGDNLAFYVNGTAYHQHLNHGTAASPVTVGSGPTIKVCRTEAVTEASMPSGIGANNQGNAAIWGASQGLVASEAQAVGVLATAASWSTQSAHNDDACGINAQGAIQIAGTGTGIGGYLEGRRDTNTAKALGLEVSCRNYTASNGSYNSSGFSDTTGLWICNRATNGATQNSVGVAFGNPDSVKWDVGIGFTSQNGGPIVNASIRDDSNSATSIILNGTHSGYGIDFNGGTFTGGAFRLKNNIPVMARNAAGSTDIEVWRFNGSDRIQFSTTMQWVDGASVLLGSSAGSMLGSASSQKLGFWGATPVIRQTVTGSRGANAALASLLTALSAAGIVTDSSSA